MNSGGISAAEAKLRQRIRGTEKTLYLDSLAALRSAACRVWAPDVPTIIRDYTSHGVDHIERVAAWVLRLISCSRVRFEPRELYVLLAGVYMHDIGMQCDLVRHPDVLERAKELGAVFDVLPSTSIASDWTTEEQIALRSNHGVVAAAWIDVARTVGDSVIGDAVRTIPERLVQEVMDVVMYHSRLPISDCPDDFGYYPNCGKRKVAAILRFADELDVTRLRVSTLDTILSFSIDPGHAFHWWLHNATEIEFVSEHKLLVTVSLHPKDYERYSATVQDEFLLPLQMKNVAVLEVLSDAGIPIIFSNDSGVRSNRFAQPVPEELRSELDRRPPYESTDERIILAREVRLFLVASGYEVSGPECVGPYCEMVATLDKGLLRQQVLVRCLEGAIGVRELKAYGGFSEDRTRQIWLVTARSVSTGARRMAVESDVVRVMDYKEMVSSVWGPYFDSLLSPSEDQSLAQYYIDPRCYQLRQKNDGPAYEEDEFDSLDEYADGWLRSPDQTTLMLLGSFGAGKTSFIRLYAVRQLRRYLNSPLSERIPLVISLRGYGKVSNVAQLIADSLTQVHRLRLPTGASLRLFEQLNRRGKLLILLDGFDEMASQVNDSAMRANFESLMGLATPNSKLILTSRTEYFRRALEIDGALRQGESVSSRSGCEATYISPLDDDQVRQVILQRLGKRRGTAVADEIQENWSLCSMARKPVMIELLIAAHDELRRTGSDYSIGEVSLAEIYKHATHALILRNISVGRTFTSEEDKVRFLKLLAWEMIDSGDLRISCEEIPSRIGEYFRGRLDEGELVAWDYDLRSQTMLHRDPEGRYEFAHKSLAEYFAALHAMDYLTGLLEDGELTAERVEVLARVSWKTALLQDFIDGMLTREMVVRLAHVYLRASEPGEEVTGSAYLGFLFTFLAPNNFHSGEWTGLAEHTVARIEEIELRYDRGLITKEQRRHEVTYALHGEQGASSAEITEFYRSLVGRLVESAGQLAALEQVDPSQPLRPEEIEGLAALLTNPVPLEYRGSERERLLVDLAVHYREFENQPDRGDGVPWVGLSLLWLIDQPAAWRMARDRLGDPRGLRKKAFEYRWGPMTPRTTPSRIARDYAALARCLMRDPQGPSILADTLGSPQHPDAEWAMVADVMRG